MVFSSPVFLFGFLPIALLIYYLSSRSIKNITLLMLSLLFYAWGEVFYLAVMIASIISNYVFGRLIYGSLREDNKLKYGSPQLYLTCGIVVNIGLLISFKYTNFIADNINTLFLVLDISTIDIEPVHLPLGISFFTFQAISYIVDVYRKEVEAQKNIYDLALYISLFPQLIAGPIVRYHDVALQIIDRTHSIELFASGVQRFIIGLAKKMLIANSMGEIADNVFLLSGNDLTMPLAWIGILAYTLQIYFDFSGYSDMAIGLGRMFGFRFHENFNYPYIAKSLREFWRRWHISLSTWFRDYLYIPLGGSRVSTIRVYCNLLIVFVLTGVWHGASWNFVVWGLFHGFFLASEHMGFSRILSRIWSPIQHLYLILVIILSWVLFRADNITHAMDYYSAMLNMDNWHTSALQYARVSSDESIYVFVIGCVFTMPVYLWLKHYLSNVSKNSKVKIVSLVYIPKFTFLLLILLVSILKTASSTYNPFIYFRF